MKTILLIISAIIITPFLLVFFSIIFRNIGWNKTIKEGTLCNIFLGQDRIYDCIVIYRAGNWVVVKDLLGHYYVRNINECYCAFL